MTLRNNAMTIDPCAFHLGLAEEVDLTQDSTDQRTFTIGEYLYAGLERMAQTYRKDLNALVEGTIRCHLSDLQADIWARRTWVR